jgi:hypothetical protein
VAIDPNTGQEMDPFAPFRLGDAMRGAVPLPTGPRTIEEMASSPLAPAPLPSLRSGADIPAPPGLPSPSEPAQLSPLPLPPPPEPVGQPVPNPGAQALDAALRIGPDTRTTGISRQSKDAIRKAAGKLDELGDKQKDLIERGTQVAEEKATEVARDEDEVRLDRAAQEELARQERTKIDGQIVEARSIAKDLREKHKNDYEKGFFETKGAAKTWLAALSVGLGAFAASMNRTPNYAWNILEKFMDDHAAREKARLQQQKDEIERAGGDVTALERQLRDYDTITRPQQEAALLRKASERRSALLARYGADEARINGDTLKLRADEEAARREMDLEKSIASTVVSDNSAQNELRRKAALAQAGGGNGPDIPDEKMTAETRKAQSVINGALTATKKAAQFQYSKKDLAVLNEMVSASRNVDPSDPTKFWAAMAQLKGKYYNQVSAGGKERFNAFFRAGQDLERITSGGVIGTHEIADMLAASSAKGSESVIIQRARDMLPSTGQPNKVGAQISAVESQLGIGSRPAAGRATASPPAGPAPAANAAVNRATALQLLRSSNISDLHKRALEQIRDNPNDPRASRALEKIRSAY